MKKRKDDSESFKRKDYSNLEILASAGINVEEINALAEKARGSYLCFCFRKSGECRKRRIATNGWSFTDTKCWCRERKGDWTNAYCKKMSELCLEQMGICAKRIMVLEIAIMEICFGQK